MYNFNGHNEMYSEVARFYWTGRRWVDVRFGDVSEHPKGCYGFDYNGNMTTNLNLGRTNFLSYDEENRLIKCSNSASVSYYKYDAFGRRIYKSVNGVQEKYIYDASKYPTGYDGLDVLCDYDGNNDLKASYVFHPQSIDDPIMMSRANSSNFYYMKDGLGSVTAILDENGTVRNLYKYDAFGTCVSNYVTVSNRYFYTSREYDEESGLYFYRARMYDSKIGRFTSEDPILDGNNWYAYVGNNPMNFVDKDGESRVRAGRNTMEARIEHERLDRVRDNNIKAQRNGKAPGSNMHRPGNVYNNQQTRKMTKNKPPYALPENTLNATLGKGAQVRISQMKIIEDALESCLDYVEYSREQKDLQIDFNKTMNPNPPSLTRKDNPDTSLPITWNTPLNSITLKNNVPPKSKITNNYYFFDAKSFIDTLSDASLNNQQQISDALRNNIEKEIEQRKSEDLDNMKREVEDDVQRIRDTDMAEVMASPCE